jgi:raffinose/stachyose/melibiose transport system permease protein
MSTPQNFTVKKRINWPEISFKVLFLLPAFVALGVFMYYPIVDTFRISTMRASGLGEEVYIGLANYIKLFSNEDFLLGLLHVLQWAFWSVVIQIPLAFLIAFACSNYKTRTIKSLRSVYYLSNVLPAPVTGMLGIFLFGPNSGVIVTFARTIGWKWLERIDFLGNPNLAFWSLFALATWAYMGFGIIYLMANIEQIPVEIREAAQIDGANRWQYARYIVIPQISYALLIQSILCIVGSLKLFELPWIVTKGGPAKSTITLVTTLYQEGFLNWQYGKGCAIGVVIFALSLIFTIILFSMQRDNNKKELG